MEVQSKTMRYAGILTFCLVLVWSAINPHDYPTWSLEVFPVLIAAAVMLYTREAITTSSVISCRASCR